jgi:regulator of protease activity HflC (stomatin/prohibitin superfamily)
MLQVAAFALLLGLSFWQHSHVLAALSRFLLVGVPIWFVLYVVTSQIRRVHDEALETQELLRAREAGTTQGIFELDEEALLLEQNRLNWLVRWLLPACTILVSLLLLIGHFALWGWSPDEVLDASVLKRTGQPTLIMWFLVGIGFLCFLYARYALALARLPGWGLLRAGAVCLAGSALACILVAIALMAAGTIGWAEPLVAYVIRVALLVLGIELAVNFILDLYRPRRPGEVSRPSFDSRLLGMVADPGGIAKSVADAVNYQFGFHVSSTWLYKLLERWLFPIAVFAFIAVILLTGIVVVDADEQAVVERFGRLINAQSPILSPGIRFKWPYPIDIVRRAPVKRIGELVIGEPAEDNEEHADDAVLWTEVHEFVPEMMLLVASPKLEKLSEERESGAPGARNPGATQSVAVSLLMVSVPIEYRIKDLTKYLYTYVDPERLMEAVAYQFLSDYAASVDIDELIGPGREAFNRDLKGLLQARLDELDVGIEIVLCGIRGAHPPAKEKVAAAFQGVVSAETSMAATIHAAEGAALRILTTVAGTETRARELDEAIQARDALPPGSAMSAKAKQQVEDLLTGDPDRGVAPVSGQAAVMIANAKAAASVQMSRAAAKAVTFGTQVAAFEAARSLYRHRKLLEVYENLGNTRKYLIVGDRSNVIIEYETATQAGLDQVLSEGVEQERRQRNP